jgi:hypothetical protein
MPASNWSRSSSKRNRSPGFSRAFRIADRSVSAISAVRVRGRSMVSTCIRCPFPVSFRRSMNYGQSVDDYMIMQ